MPTPSTIKAQTELTQTIRHNSESKFCPFRFEKGPRQKKPTTLAYEIGIQGCHISRTDIVELVSSETV